MTARSDAQSAHERNSALVLEIDADSCANGYGAALCEAGRVLSGTAQAGASQSLTLADGVSAVSDVFSGLTVRITGGAGAEQERQVVASRKNLFKYSSQFNNTYWSASKSVIVSITPDDDGAAEKFTVGSWVSGQTIAAIAFNVSNALYMTGSVEVNPGNSQYCFLRFFGVANTLVRFDFINQITAVIVDDAGGYISSEITPTSDGYYRIKLTVFNTTQALVFFRLQFSDTAGNAFGNTTGKYLWARRAQLVEGVTEFEYIETNATPAVGVIIDQPWDTLPDATSTYDLIDRRTACYNTIASCKDKIHFSKTVLTYQYCLRGMPIPPGESLRPYISSFSFTPSEIPLGGGLATRGRNALTLVDEVCADLDDPYRAYRVAPAQGTYWTRWLERNKYRAGRPARLRKGYITTPFNWGVFQSELNAVTTITGPDGSGNIQVVLGDYIKMLDKAMLPLSTDGKLMADLKAIEYAGVLLAADATHATFAEDAPAVDGALVGMEIYVSANTGAGQRRVVLGYVGATRVAELTAAWSVIPDATSVALVSALSINVGSGNGAQYADPVAAGEQQFVRVGNESIRYSAIAGDVLSWADATYRAQFGTTRADHQAGDAVQLCFAPIDKPASEVIQIMLNSAGLADEYIDLVGLVKEDTDWLGTAAHITACIHKPEKASSLLHELLLALNMNSWWDAVAAQQKFKCDMPQSASSVVAITPDETVFKSMQITPLDAQILTRSFLAFAPYCATGNMTENTNFSINTGYVDSEAEGPNEHNAIFGEQKYSRWFTAANQNFVKHFVTRRVSRNRDAPFKAAFKLDPRNEVRLGDLIDVTSRKKPDFTGAPVTTRMRVTKLLDNKLFEVEATSTTFAQRYAIVAPNGLPNYALASAAQREYAYIAGSDGLMSDGSSAYLIS